MTSSAHGGDCGCKLGPAVLQEMLGGPHYIHAAEFAQAAVAGTMGKGTGIAVIDG